MKITEQILNGDIPATEDELHFLAKNHDKYNLTRLNVSEITDFSNLFDCQVNFNQPIGKWDVSNGTNFSGIFYNAKSFNQPIGNWDVSNGTCFRFMFAGAELFNQPIGNWDVSNCNNFSCMFYCATTFNQPLGNWDVSNGINFSYMFCNAKAFNQPIGNWDVSKGTDFSCMFYDAISFNQPICNWKIKKEYLVHILESNFYLSIQHSFEKIGFTCNADQLSLLFKDSPDSPFKRNFNYNAKELTLITSNNFHGFVDENNNAYQIDTDKATIDELIEICDIKTINNIR